MNLPPFFVAVSLRLFLSFLAGSAHFYSVFPDESTSAFSYISILPLEYHLFYHPSNYFPYDTKFIS